MRETDATVGRVLEALDAHGLTDSTLVIATSDHGAAPYAGNKRAATPGLNSRTRKARPLFQWDLSRVQVHRFRRWPSRAAPGAFGQELSMPARAAIGLSGLIDVLATLADISGVELRADEAPDSISFAELLKDPLSAAPRATLVMQSPLAFALRHQRWKLAVTPGSGSRGLWGTRPAPERAWKEALESFGSRPSETDLRKAPFVQLFDLEADVQESANLAYDRPEIVERLSKILDATIETGAQHSGAGTTQRRSNGQSSPQCATVAREICGRASVMASGASHHGSGGWLFC